MNFLSDFWTQNTNELSRLKKKKKESVFPSQSIQACAFADCTLGLSSIAWQETKAQPTHCTQSERAAERGDSDTG